MFDTVFLCYQGVVYRFARSPMEDERIRTLVEEERLVRYQGGGAVHVIVPDVPSLADRHILEWLAEDRRELLSWRLDALEMPKGIRRPTKRLRDCCANAGYEYWWQLVERTEAELLRLKFFGRKSTGEMRNTLTLVGVDLGMRLLIDQLRDQLPQN